MADELLGKAVIPVTVQLDSLERDLDRAEKAVNDYHASAEKMNAESAARAAKVQSENMRLVLESEGKTLEAREHEINEYYDNLIKRAQSAAEKEALIVQQNLKLDKTRREESHQANQRILDDLNRTVVDTERSVVQSSQNMQNNLDGIGGVLGGAKMLLAGEKLKGIVSGVGIAVSLAQGNSEALERSFRQLPFGLGEAVGTAIDLYKELSGSADAAERMQKAIESADRAAESLASTQSEMASLRATTPELRQRLVTADADARIAELKTQMQEAAQELDDALKTSGDRSGNVIAEMVTGILGGAEAEAEAIARNQLEVENQLQAKLLGRIKSIQDQIDAEKELAEEKRQQIQLERNRQWLAENAAQEARRQAAEDAAADLVVRNDFDRQIAQQERRIKRLTQEFSSGGFADAEQAEAIRAEIRLAEAMIQDIQRQQAERTRMDAEREAKRTADEDRRREQETKRIEETLPGRVENRLSDFFDFEENPFDRFFSDDAASMRGSSEEIALARSAVNVGQAGDGVERQQLTELQQLVAQARQQQAALDGIKSNLEFQ